MEKPKLSEQHRRFDRLVGQWLGDETLFESPFGPGNSATGSWDFRLTALGFFLSGDYSEQVKGQPLLHGHAVIGWNPKHQLYTLHWFDNVGGAQEKPSLGTWEGDRLSFVHQTPGERSRTTFEVAGDRCFFLAEKSLDQGESWRPLIEGKYRRR